MELLHKLLPATEVNLESCQTFMMELPEDLEVLGVPGFPRVLVSQDWVPLFYHTFLKNIVIRKKALL